MSSSPPKGLLPMLNPEPEKAQAAPAEKTGQPDDPLVFRTRTSQERDSAHVKAKARFMERPNLGLTVEELDQMQRTRVLSGLQTSLWNDDKLSDPFESRDPAPRRARRGSFDDSILQGVGDLFNTEPRQRRLLKSKPTTMESPLSPLGSSADASAWQLPPVDTSRGAQEELEALMTIALAGGDDNFPREDVIRAEMSGGLNPDSIPLRNLSSPKGSRKHASGGDDKTEPDGTGTNPPADQNTSNQSGNQDQTNQQPDGDRPGQSGNSGQPPPPAGGDGSGPPKKPNQPNDDDKIESIPPSRTPSLPKTSPKSPAQPPADPPADPPPPPPPPPPPRSPLHLALSRMRHRVRRLVGRSSGLYNPPEKKAKGEKGKAIPSR